MVPTTPASLALQKSIPLSILSIQGLAAGQIQSKMILLLHYSQTTIDIFPQLVSEVSDTNLFPSTRLKIQVDIKSKLLDQILFSISTSIVGVKC
jgi:hypothetical protein